MVEAIPTQVLQALDAGVPAVRAVREGKSKSTEAVATQSGIAADRLAEIEAGERPTADETMPLAIALGVGLDVLEEALGEPLGR